MHSEKRKLSFVERCWSPGTWGLSLEDTELAEKLLMEVASFHEGRPETWGGEKVVTD